MSFGYIILPEVMRKWKLRALDLSWYIYLNKIHSSQTRIFIISYKEYLGVGNKENSESNQAEYTLNLKKDLSSTYC